MEVLGSWMLDAGGRHASSLWAIAGLWLSPVSVSGSSLLTL